MIRDSKSPTDGSTRLQPFQPVPPEVLERRRQLLRETAGCWSKEVADFVASELDHIFEQVDDEDEGQER